MRNRCWSVAATVVLACVLSCAAGDLQQTIGTFVQAARGRRDVAATFDDTARALKLRRLAAHHAEGTFSGFRIRMFLRRFDGMPGGARSWITFRVEAPPADVERALIAKLGKHDGRGFGDEDGWLLPTGGLILERFDDHADITFSPGPPEDALEDLAKPHLPSLDELERSLGAAGWRLLPPQRIATNVMQRPAARGDDTLQLTSIEDARRLVAVHGEEAAVNGAVGVTGPGTAQCAGTGNYFVVRETGGITVWRRPFAMWNVDVQRQCHP